MRQYAGMVNAEESNKRYLFLLAQRTSGLSDGLRVAGIEAARN